MIGMQIFKIIIILIMVTLKAEAMIILLDPGHGGEDLGANATFTDKQGKKTVIHEKDLTLELSNKIYQKIKHKYVVFRTRSIDRFVSLDERAAMAEKVKADLFISVHINSSDSASSHGFETYYLDNNKSKAVKRVEDIENKAISNKEDLVIHHILTDLVIQKTVKKSIQFAEFVHRGIRGKIKKKYNLADRGVKAGLFFVLFLSKRPGILLEAGFISNPKELNIMFKEDFQERYAQGVAQGIEEYVKAQQKDNIPVL